MPVAPFKVAGPFDTSGPNQAFASVLPGPGDCLFRPAGTRRGNVYPTWVLCASAVASYDGFTRQVSFDDGGSGAGCTIPTGPWTMGTQGEIAWVGRADGNELTVTIASGATFDALPTTFKNLSVYSAAIAPTTPWTINVGARASHRLAITIEGAGIGGDAVTRLPLIALTDPGAHGGAVEIRLADAGFLDISAIDLAATLTLEVTLSGLATVNELAITGAIANATLYFKDYPTLLLNAPFFTAASAPVAVVNQSGQSSFVAGGAFITVEQAFRMAGASAASFLPTWEVIFDSGTGVATLPAGTYALGGSGGHTVAGTIRGTNDLPIVTIDANAATSSCPDELTISDLALEAAVSALPALLSTAATQGAAMTLDIARASLTGFQRPLLQAVTNPLTIVLGENAVLDATGAGAIVIGDGLTAIAIRITGGGVVLGPGSVDDGAAMARTSIAVLVDTVIDVAWATRLTSIAAGVCVALAGDPVTLVVPTAGTAGAFVVDTTTGLRWQSSGTAWAPVSNVITYKPGGGAGAGLAQTRAQLFTALKAMVGVRTVYVDLRVVGGAQTWNDGVGWDTGGETIWIGVFEDDGTPPQINFDAHAGDATWLDPPYAFTVQDLVLFGLATNGGNVIQPNPTNAAPLTLRGDALIGCGAGSGFYVANGGVAAVVTLHDRAAIDGGDDAGIVVGTNANPGTSVRIDALDASRIAPASVEHTAQVSIRYLSTAANVSPEYSAFLALVPGVLYPWALHHPVTDAVPVPEAAGALWGIRDTSLVYYWSGASWLLLATGGKTTLVAGVSPAIAVPQLTATSRVVFGRGALNASTALGELAALAGDRVNGHPGSFKIRSLRPATLAVETGDVSDVDWYLADGD